MGGLVSTKRIGKWGILFTIYGNYHFLTKIPTVTADLDMKNYKILRLSNPTASPQAANKRYVDTQVATCLTETKGDTLYLKLHPQDSLGASLSMGNNRITTLGNPTDQLDAANKRYVDSKLGQSGMTQHTVDNRYLSLNEGGLKGNLNMNKKRIFNLGNPTEDDDAISKKYFEDQTVGVYLPMTGGTISGQVAMSGAKITGLGYGTGEGDAASIAWVKGQSSGGFFPKDANGNLEMGEKRVVSLADPVDPNDATNKSWVESKMVGSYLPLGGGTMTGGIDMGGKTIGNLSSPKHFKDAISQDYADATYLSKTGGVSGEIIMDGGDRGPQKITRLLDPTGDSDAVTRRYLDGEVKKALPLSGGALGGDLIMNDNLIRGPGNPENDTDATPRKWVEDRIKAYTPKGSWELLVYFTGVPSGTHTLKHKDPMVASASLTGASHNQELTINFAKDLEDGIYALDFDLERATGKDVPLNLYLYGDWVLLGLRPRPFTASIATPKRTLAMEG